MNILRSECCFLFLEFILIRIAFASHNSSDKLKLCHAGSLRLMVLLFDPLSLFFVRLMVNCGNIIQGSEIYIGSIRVYGNRGEDSVNGFDELIPVLSLLSVKSEGFHVTTSRYILRAVTAWWGWNFSQKLSDCVVTEQSGAWDVAGSMNAVSETVKALCDAGVPIAVSVAAVTKEQLLQLKFSDQSFAAARPLLFTWN